MRLVNLLAALAAMALMTAACSSATTVESGDTGSSSDGTAQTDDGAGADNESASDADDTADTADGATDTDDAAGDQSEDDDPTGPTYDAGPEQVESLTKDCAADVDMACDILFAITKPGAETDAIVAQCGERASRPIPDGEYFFCTEGFDLHPDGGPWFDPTSPGLDTAVQACEDGDMTACDFLFFRASPGSEHERIGTTCAGRVTAALPDCRTELGE